MSGEPHLLPVEVDAAPDLQASKEEEEDDYDDEYFSSYTDVNVHKLMLKDAPRTEAYRNFIEKNQHLIKGKIVVDVGAGTGILSLFAAKAGAKHVSSIIPSYIRNQYLNNKFLLCIIQKKKTNFSILKCSLSFMLFYSLYCYNDKSAENMLIANFYFHRYMQLKAVR